ncbi:MAG: 1-acyl-sn-glycerol-3-phosphate acyltransferase [Anaerolineaceae bacterium]|nr:1-acyl-sn-glycerol-3-phosphate acyltransferase [Anaerolineaceae bacterium]
MRKYKIRYPRKVIPRTLFRILGWIALGLFSRLKIKGRKNLPKKGPVILAGNHVSGLEAMILMVYSPHSVEFLCAGDIPFDPSYAWLANAYGRIPVNRGNIDRAALYKTLDLLKQNGYLGIFPEGGIWDPAKMEAQTGIALISERSGAPIVPIGFGGMKGAMRAAFKLKRPRIVMNVGKMIPPIKIDKDEDRRTALQSAANSVMEQIFKLVPENELNMKTQRIEEQYALEVKLNEGGDKLPIPNALVVTEGSAFAHLMFTPVLLDTLLRNLKLPIKPLSDVKELQALKPFNKAIKSILDYLVINPGFFTYRLGMDEGLRVAVSLKQILDLAIWAEKRGYTLSLIPVRKYRNQNTKTLVIEKGGSLPHSMTK